MSLAQGRVRLLLLRVVGHALRAPTAQAELPATASILIIRPDHLGDVLLAAPAIGMLRRGLPAARLSYLVGPWGEEVARRGPPVDEVLTCPFPGFTRQPRPSMIQPYRLLLAEAARLRRRRFDAALVLRPDHWWGALLAASAGIPVRLGYGAPECSPFLTHALPWPSGESYQAASVSLVRRLLALAGTADTDVAARPERFRVDEAERAHAASLLSDQGLNPPLVALHPGSGARLKLWPAERWIEVGTALAARRSARLVVTGSREEQPLAEQIATGIGSAATSVAGRTSLGQLAALFERVQLALGPDSGPLHLAASVGTPTVRLFGPTDPELFMPEGLPNQAALTTRLSCRPCHALDQAPCGAQADPACLTGLDVNQVIAATSAALNYDVSPRAPLAPSPSKCSEQTVSKDPTRSGSNS